MKTSLSTVIYECSNCGKKSKVKRKVELCEYLHTAKSVTLNYEDEHRDRYDHTYYYIDHPDILLNRKNGWYAIKHEDMENIDILFENKVNLLREYEEELCKQREDKIKLEAAIYNLLKEVKSGQGDYLLRSFRSEVSFMGDKNDLLDTSIENLKNILQKVQEIKGVQDE